MAGKKTGHKMRTFDHFNKSFGAICPVCQTNKDCETVLVGIPGTESDGNIEAQQIHKKCYDLVLEMLKTEEGA